MTAPSDDKYGGLYAALNRARRESLRWQSTRPARLISDAIEGYTAKQPETYQYDKEPFDFLEVKRRLDGRHALVPRQKRPAHRPREHRVGELKVQVVEEFRRMTADPKVKKPAVHQELADKHGITVKVEGEIV
jgi:hypothetical protein